MTKIRGRTQLLEHLDVPVIGMDNPQEDAIIIPQLITPSSIITFTTTGNIDNLDFGNATLIRMNNASLATIRGLKAGYPGQKVTIISIGAGEVDLAHQNANSTAENRLINFVTSGVTPLAAGFGKCSYQYDTDTARWRLIQHEQGTYITPGFSAGDWTGNGSMTVTVSAVLTDEFYIKGKLFFYNFFLGNTSISIAGTPSNLIQRTIPNGYTTASTGEGGPLRVFDNGTYRMGFGFAFSSTSTTKILFSIFDLSNFAASAANSGLFGSLNFTLD